MKKKLMLTAATLALIAATVPAALAFAQTQQPGPQALPAIKDGLAIVAPRVAPVDKEVSMTVFRRSDQTPVEGAGVWAVTQDKIEALKADMDSIKGNNDAAQQESTLALHAALLGRTDDKGKVFHTFDDAGRYLLVTFKAGYWPDMTAIAVGVKPLRLPALTINALGRADVGERVTITVNEKATGDAVKDAGVWALSREKAEAIKAELADRKSNADAAQLESIVEDTLNVNGTFLGTTNGAGKLTTSFDADGTYLLATYKRGFLPAYKPILIGTSVGRALVIQAPRKAVVDQNVAITVVEKATGDAVKDAKVWALSKDQALSLREEIAALKSKNDHVAIENAINSHAMYLGSTNGAGKLNHKFDVAGGYLLVTYKAGYWPGMAPIVITPETASPDSKQGVRRMPDAASSVAVR